MAKIYSMMDVGKRSMMNSQTALQTVGHNIANKSTEGFSRQRVEIQSNQPVQSGKNQIGMGAKTGAVTRTVNPFLEKQLRNEGMQLGFDQAKSDAMMRVEQVYNEQVNKGLNKSLGEFFNAFREFSTNPENTATRTLVRDTAASLTKDFAKTTQNLKAIQTEIDQQVRQHVDALNKYAEEIAQLNQEIASVEVTGAHANDQRDRRELLVKKMNEITNVRTAENNRGVLTVTVGNSAIMVSGETVTKLEVGSVQNDNMRGDVHMAVFFQPTQGADPMNISKEIKSGQLGGIFEVRDNIIVGLLNDVDELAYSFSKEVNSIHRQGYDLYNVKGGDFFATLDNKLHAAENLTIAKDVVKDPGRIVAAMIPHAPGDNRIANMIGQLQHQRIMDGGNSTFDDFYNSIVGKVGVSAERANQRAQSQKNIFAQLENIRDSISGVSLDEEAQKMIEFQKTFDASARLITTADEMLDTVINMKKL